MFCVVMALSVEKDFSFLSQTDGLGCGIFHVLEDLFVARQTQFYHSAISEHVVRARIMVEIGSHPTKRFLFNHTTPFSTKGLEKSLCDFAGTIFVQCENPVIATGFSRFHSAEAH